MDVVLVALGVVVALALVGAAWLTRRLGHLYIVKLSLADAPEPYWSEIREVLEQTRLVSVGALRAGCRRWPPVTSE